MDEVVINGVEYVKKENDAQIKIVILQRGWVMVGNLERTGSDCVLKNAAVVRVWGTKRGLGEIAQAGPTKEDRKSTRLNSSHSDRSRMPSSA